MSRTLNLPHCTLGESDSKHAALLTTVDFIELGVVSFIPAQMIRSCPNLVREKKCQCVA